MGGSAAGSYCLRDRIWHGDLGRTLPIAAASSHDSGNQQELEGGSIAFNASLLPNDQGRTGEDEKIPVWDGGTRTGRGAESENANAGDSSFIRRGAELDMPKVRLEPDENIRLRYSAPESGLVEFEIEADHPVMTYILRPRGLELFDQGSKTFKYYGGFQDPRKKQAQELRLPFEGPWYLLIINPDKRNSVGVNYEVRY
jgi:hypothetical protein